MYNSSAVSTSTSIQHRHQLVKTVLNSNCVAVFNSRLKISLSRAFSSFFAH